MTRHVCALFLSIPIVCTTALLGQSISEPSGVTIGVAKTGTFTIQSGNPAWVYSGSIPGHPNYIAGPNAGSDNNQVSTNGLFDEFTVQYADPEGHPWSMRIRAYRSVPSATISFSPLTDVANKRPYATLSQFPVTAHHFSNGGWDRTFGLLGWLDSDSPWVFYDDQYRTAILSSASRPISQRQSWIDDGTVNGSIALKIDTSNTMLHGGDVYSHLITFGPGIGKTFRTWGLTLSNIFGRRRTGSQADLSLIVPMLSTDAGATYYYAFNESLGYEGTLQAAINSAKSVGIRMGIVHFDSWWQMKGGNCDSPDDSSGASWSNSGNGAWKYVMDPALFKPIDPSDLEQGFIQHLGPGMAHARWVDTCSAYRAPLLDASGNVLDANPVSGNVVIDPTIWARVAHTLKQSGIAIFEPDFLSAVARAANTFDDEKFLDAMATAMGEQGIDVQYCMPLARHMLLAFKYERVHTIRVSPDRFQWSHWDKELYGSIIVNAGGVWPTVDNFRTTETRNLLMAVLSAGPLALGDATGAFVPINEAIRSDGLILKPDVSMVPTDASFVSEATAIEQFNGLDGSPTQAGNGDQPILPPLVAHTYSDFGFNKVEYVFAYSRDVTTPAPMSFSPQDFGFTGEVYVYDYFHQTGRLQPATQSITATVDSQGSYFVIAPVGQSQMAFLGDLSRFVPASRHRVPSLSDDGHVTATIRFKPGETVPLSFYAPSKPLVSVDQGTVTAPVLNAATGLYQVTIASGNNKLVTIRIMPGSGQ
jgi:hypothetical protein